MAKIPINCVLIHEKNIVFKWNPNTIEACDKYIKKFLSGTNKQLGDVLVKIFLIS